MRYIDQTQAPGFVPPTRRGLERLASPQESTGMNAMLMAALLGQGNSRTTGGLNSLRAPTGGGGDVEIFYGGNRFNPSSVDSTHPEHLHFAMERGPVNKVLRRIDRMPGFEVGENPLFGGVAPVHKEGSWHYRRGPSGGGRAGDINYTAGEGGRFDDEASALNWLERWLVGHYG